MLASRPLHAAVCLFVRNVALSLFRVWPAFVLSLACQTNGVAPVLRAMDVDYRESLGDRRSCYVLICSATPSPFRTCRVSTRTGLAFLPDGWEGVSI